MIIVVTADELSKLFSISLCINYILVVLKIDNHDYPTFNWILETAREKVKITVGVNLFEASRESLANFAINDVEKIVDNDGFFGVFD